MKKKIKCWEFFECNETECPVYRLRELKCWLISGTHCRQQIQGQFLEKMEMCLECEPFNANMDPDSMEDTLKVVNRQFNAFRTRVEKRDRELQGIGMELAMGVSEVFVALKDISAGDPSVRIPTTSKLELIGKLKDIVNLTAENIAEIVGLSHEFAMGLAEHFDVLHRVSQGALGARVSGSSEIELLQYLKKVTNEMIESVSSEMAERRSAEEALRKARSNLEKRVDERTAELSKANALLRNEIADREAAEKACHNTNEELNSFFRVVSHDLKTPIISIQGFSDRLLKKYREELGEHGRKYVKQISDSAHRMETLVLDLLELSRVGQVDSIYTKVSSVELLKDVIVGLQERLRNNGIEVVVAENAPTIYCDRNKMYQVFENLLVNAIKFTKATKVPKIEIVYEDKGKFHQFDIKDNGIGIEDRHHREIFEVFRQLKEIEDKEGTGLGLTIVQRIVNGHGGRVWVESEKGKGATFCFTLPKTL